MYFFPSGKIKIVGISITMALVKNSFDSIAISDVKLTVKTGTSQQADFTIEHVDYTALLAAADAAADAAIAEYVVQAFTLTGAAIGTNQTDLTAVDGSYTVADASGTATFTVVVSGATVSSVALLSAGTGYTTNATLTLAITDLGGTAVTVDATGTTANVGVIADATLTAAADAATAVSLTTLAAAITGAANDAAAAKAVLDAAILAGGAIGAAIAADTTAGITQLDKPQLEDGNYRIAYSDAIGAVNYAAANNVQVIQFSMVNGAMVGSHAKLSNVKSNITTSSTGVTTSNTATKITGTLTFVAAADVTASNTANGKGYGIQVTHVNSGSSASVGAGGAVPRVIVNGGPNNLADDFRVNLTAVADEPTKATIEFKLSGTTKATHTTGKHTDLKWLRFMWADAITCVFKTQDIDLRANTVYNGGSDLLVSRQVDFGSTVATTLFEYSAALIDTAGAVSEYASTDYASSVADNATNVRDIAIYGDSALGSTIKVNWVAPSFTAKTITGYEIVVQEMSLDSGEDEVCNIAKSGNTVSTVTNANIAYKVTSAAGATTPTYSPTTIEYTVTGLTVLKTYAVWVRATHADEGSVKVYGSIGSDKMNAPSQVYVADSDGSGNAGLIAFDATKHSWAGSYLEGASGATPINVTEYNASIAGTPVFPILFDKLDNTTTEVIDTLTGAPANFATGTSITIVGGINVQANYLATVAYTTIGGGTDVDATDAYTMPVDTAATGDDLMETSLAIKWDDRDINFNGMETGTVGKTLEYICLKTADYNTLEGLSSGTVTSYLAGTLQKTAATSQQAATYYVPSWSTAVTKDSKIGEGKVTSASYGAIATANHTRYCRFSADVSVPADSTLATFNSLGKLTTNGTEATVLPFLTTVVLNSDKDALVESSGITSNTGSLTLGTSYRFILRLSNDNGQNAHKLMDAHMVTGRASASTFLKEDAAAATDLIADTSLMWNNDKFEFKITNQHTAGTTATSDDVTLTEPTGATALADMDYEVFVSAVQGDARHSATGNPGSDRPAYAIAATTAIPCSKTVSGNLTTVTFNKVWAKAITYYENTGTAESANYPAATNATSESEVLLSALYGWKFTIKLVAKNSNGSRFNVAASTGPTVAKEGDVTFGDARQAFAEKSVFEGIATAVTKTKPADTVSGSVTTSYDDARSAMITYFGVDTSDNGTNAIDAAVATPVIFLSASIKDLTSTNFDLAGRKVDSIRYEVFQTLSDGSKHPVKTSEDVDPSHWITTSTDSAGVVTETAVASATAGRNINQGLDLVYRRDIPTWENGVETTYSQSTTNEITLNRFNTWVKKDATKKGYKLKMKISLVSSAAPDLAESPAKSSLVASSSEYVTATETITYNTIPFETHDEVSHLTGTAGDGKMTLYWSAPNMATPELQGAGSTTPVLKGYQIEVYDVITRAAGDDSAGVARNFLDENASGNGSATTTDAKATPVKTILYNGIGGLDKDATFKEITGLINGKHYIPIIRTVTEQGADNIVYSVGRTLEKQIGSIDDQAVKHDVKVFYAGTTTLAYTAARWKAVNTTSVQTADDDMTTDVLDTTNAVMIPYGTPFIVANLTATPNTLKIDDNGRGLLYGAMLQTAVGGNNGAASTASQRLGTLSEANQANVNDNVFYLDLSFGQTANTAGAGETPVYPAAFDDGSVTIYASVATADAGTPYPGRNVTNVNSKYLGDNWSAETNFIFASNQAGTTVGKIASSTYAAVTQTATP